MTKRILRRDERAYKNIVAVAKMLEAFSAHEAKYEIRDVYFGADWMWTTICRTGYRNCQVLCPRDWEKVVNAENATQLAEIVEEIRSGKYFND